MYATLGINMTDPEPLLFFCATFGVGRLYGPTERPGGRKPIYAIHLAKREDVVRVVDHMLPYIRSARRRMILQQTKLLPSSEETTARRRETSRICSRRYWSTRNALESRDFISRGCSVEPCPRQVRKRGMCNRHWRLWEAANPDARNVAGGSKLQPLQVATILSAKPRGRRLAEMAHEFKVHPETIRRVLRGKTYLGEMYRSART
jgi:hypothetical protein